MKLSSFVNGVTATQSPLPGVLELATLFAKNYPRLTLGIAVKETV